MNFRDIYVNWNPWHGCSKISEGCKHCYVYRQDTMYGAEKSSSEVTLNGEFLLPIKRKRDKSYKITPGMIVFTCFTSDFFVEGADPWRAQAWTMIKERSDCMFYFFTKRIDRFPEVIPSDWGEGYENVIIGCTVENQAMADYRLPLFLAFPIRHRSIIVAPMLEAINLLSYLSELIMEVSVSGESGVEARVCQYDWVLSIRQQCIASNTPFLFHQTGAKFIKDGRLYRIHRKHQIAQAHRANINYRIGKDLRPIPSDPTPTT